MQCLYIYCCRNISEGFSFCLIAEYLLFHRSRRHFIPRCVNSHPRPAAFIYSGKYSQVRSVPLFSRVPRPISETRPLCKYSSLVCDVAANAAKRHRGRLLRSGTPKCVLLTQVTWHWRRPWETRIEKTGIDRLVRRNRFALMRLSPCRITPPY